MPPQIEPAFHSPDHPRSKRVANAPAVEKSSENASPDVFVGGAGVGVGVGVGAVATITETLTLFVTLPPSPVHVSTYVAEADGFTDCPPDVAFEPFQPSEAVKEVVFVVLQLSVTD